MTCTVELFGVARMVAGTREVIVSVPAEATVAEVFAVLSATVPALAGRVVRRTGDGLVEGYACNLNGLEFVRHPTMHVRDGDRIVLLSADAGG